MNEDFEDTQETNQFLKRIPQLLYIKPNYVPELLESEFFQNKKWRIDFVLVYTKFDENLELCSKRDLFLENSKKYKIENEVAQTALPGLNLFFVKLHVSDETIKEVARVFNIPLGSSKPDIVPLKQPKYFSKYRVTMLTHHLDPGEEFIMNRNKKEITTAERSMIIHKILDQVPFGTSSSEIGIHRALYKGLFIDAFPLHEKINVPKNDEDKETEWTMYQLLRKYWASYKQIFKDQPLNALEQYFGTEVAMYHAWIESYNAWLLFLAVGALITHLLGLLYYYVYRYQFGIEVCKSRKIICPACTNPKYCSFTPLRDWCTYTNISHRYDNFFQAMFSIIMALSCGRFTSKWNQKLVILNHQWGLDGAHIDREIRIAYEIRAETKISKKTGREKFFIPAKKKACRYVISYTIMLMIMVAIGIAGYAQVIYKIYCSVFLSKHENEDIRQNYQVLLLISASTLNLISIVPMQMVYDKLAHKITEIECPRTQTEFDRAFLFKRFCFTFINYFSPLFYLAFIKGLFYTNPGDKNIQDSVILTNQCPPAGCYIELYIQLAITLTGRQLLSLIQKIIIPLLTVWWNNINLSLRYYNQLPRWEQDYRLKHYNRYTMALELHDYVIQYALVTVFTAVFPLGALIAYIFNLVEVRVTGKRLLTEIQRPVAKRICDLGIFEFIIRCITYIAIITNAFAVAVTSDLIVRWYYVLNIQQNEMKFKEFLLSKFLIADYGNITIPPLPVGYENTTICYYSGFRNPPNYLKKYQLNATYWYIRTLQLLFIIFFEHFVLSTRAFILYHTPKVPPTLVEKIDKDNIKQHKKMLNEMKKRRNLVDANKL